MPRQCFTENVFPDLLRYSEAGEGAVLATLVRVDGSSPRPVGSQMAITSEDEFTGMITGGCAERAIAAEAAKCKDRNENRLVRFGAGSPYRDIELPCGAGIDVYFETEASRSIARRVSEQHALRQSVWMHIDLENLKSSIVSDLPIEKSGHFVKRCDPDYRVFVFGEGVKLTTFCMLAARASLQVHAFSPDKVSIDALSHEPVEAFRIHRRYDYASIPFDEYCAVVTLFHDHDWEPAILQAALNSRAAYIGAMGSRKTHQFRIEALKDGEITLQKPDNIHGPIGLDIGASNPAEISVAILAEIIECRRKQEY